MSNTVIPVNDAEILERGPDGKLTGRLDWRWRLYFISRDIARFSQTAILAFPILAGSSENLLTIAVPGVAPDIGMTVTLGIPLAAQLPLVSFDAFISAKDVVTVREMDVWGGGAAAITGPFTVTVFAS